MVEQIPTVKPLPNMKDIPRRIFYKPNGEAVELLADGYHLPRYLARGFTLEPPRPQVEMQQPIPKGNGLCPICGKQCKNVGMHIKASH